MSDAPKKHPSGHAESFLPYFSKHAATQRSFVPELEVAQHVVSLMQEADSKPENFDKIIMEMHSIESRPHYDGSAWHSFRNAIQWWLESHGHSL